MSKALANVKWVKAQSWHIVESVQHGYAETLCGRSYPARVHEKRVESEKTCESCLRIGGPS